jgi:hypothetical protein
MNCSGNLWMLFAGDETVSAFDPKWDDWQRKNVKIFLTICVDVLPFYSAALILTGLLQIECQC